MTITRQQIESVIDGFLGNIDATYEDSRARCAQGIVDLMASAQRPTDGEVERELPVEPGSNYSDADIAFRMRQTWESTGDRWFLYAAERLASPRSEGHGQEEILRMLRIAEDGDVGQVLSNYRAIRRIAIAAPAPQSEVQTSDLRRVYEAARGLCHGYDWNKGTQALMHGYRRRLLDAVNAIEPVPDYEGKCFSIQRDAALATRPAGTSFGGTALCLHGCMAISCPQCSRPADTSEREVVGRIKSLRDYLRGEAKKTATCYTCYTDQAAYLANHLDSILAALPVSSQSASGAEGSLNRISEEERHAIGHARYQVERAKKFLTYTECCFDYQLVADLLRVIDRAYSIPSAQSNSEAK